MHAAIVLSIGTWYQNLGFYTLLIMLTGMCFDIIKYKKVNKEFDLH